MENKTKFASFDEVRNAMQDIAKNPRISTTEIRAVKVFSTANIKTKTLKEGQKQHVIVLKDDKGINIPNRFTNKLSKDNIIKIKIAAKQFGWTLEFDNKLQRTYVKFSGEDKEFLIVKKLYIFNEETRKIQYCVEDNLIYAVANGSDGRTIKKYLSLEIMEGLRKISNLIAKL